MNDDSLEEFHSFIESGKAFLGKGFFFWVRNVFWKDVMEDILRREVFRTELFESLASDTRHCQKSKGVLNGVFLSNKEHQNVQFLHLIFIYFFQFLSGKINKKYCLIVNNSIKMSNIDEINGNECGYDLSYGDKIARLNENIKKIDESVADLITKSNEIKTKIDMLVNKVNLKLENSTQLLQFQQSIIVNEINYFKNLKSILLMNVNNQLYDLSENISFLTMSVVNIYKDISSNEKRQIAMTHKHDSFIKIVSDINANFAYIKEMLANFQTYNEQLTKEMKDGNFHCKTLQKDMENIYNHINTEYLKYVHNASQRIEYYVEFSNKISEQIDSTKIIEFYANIAHKT